MTIAYYDKEQVERLLDYPAASPRCAERRRAGPLPEGIIA
jgi:hypothetical protein